jgi:ATP-dependent Lon protease
VTPQLGQDAYNMLQYLDAVRAGRAGVAPEGEVTPQRLGERVGSEGVAQLLNQKEELVGLIVRVIAETGIKPLCTKIRDLCIRHVNAVQNFQFKGAWVPINPAEWPRRNRATVRVGTGTGNHAKQLAALQGLLQIQASIQQMPGQALVNPQKVYATLDDICKYSELLSAAKYFVDPNSPEGQQAAQQISQSMQEQSAKQEQQAMALLQAQVQLSQAEMQKAEAQQNNVLLKGQVEQLKAALDQAKAAADNVAKDEDRILKKYEIDTKAAIELTKVEATAKAQQEANALSNRQALENKDAA